MTKRTPKEVKIRLARATVAAVGSLIFLLLLITNVHADPPTWYVDPGGTDTPDCGAVLTPCLTVGYAISEAVDGAAVVLMPGTYTQTATLSINKAITLTSQSSVSKAVLAGNGGIGQVILIESDNVVLSGLEVRNGTGDVIRQSDAYTGTVITGTIVHDCGDECVQLSNCTNCLIENALAYDAAQDGLNLSNSRNSTIRNCRVYSSSSENGAIYVYYSEALTITDNYIQDSTSSNGIKFYKFGDQGTSVIRNNTIISNSFNGQRYPQDGNAIQLYKPFDEANVDARLIVEGNTVADNTGTGDGSPGPPAGHGIYWYQGDDTATPAPVWIIDNQVINNGGSGIYIEADVVISATLRGNRIAGNGDNRAYGGGIYVKDAALVLARNVITGNNAGSGGGAYIQGGDGIVLTNNIIAANSLSETTGLGAGLYITDTRATLLHTTIAENTGGNGAGLHLGIKSTALLTNTILVSHTVGVTVTANSTVTLEATLWYGNGDDSGGSGTVVSSTHVYSAPAFFGGGDYHITLASGAVDAGVDANVDDDVDGDPRPALSGYDLGADEAPNVDEIALVASPASITANGLTTATLTATVKYKGALQDGVPVVFTTTLGVFSNWQQAVTVTATQGTAVTWLRSVPASSTVTSTVRADVHGAFTKTQVIFTENTCLGDLTAWTEYATPIFGEGVDNGPKAYYPSVLYSPTAFDNHGDEAYYKMWFGTSSSRTGYAISDDGINWVTVTVPLTDVNGYHAHVLYDAAQFSGHGDAAHYKMWYWDAGQNINYATSTNGVDWTDYPGNPVITNTLGMGSAPVYDAYVIFNSDGNPAYYEAWIDNNGRIYYITSTNGIAWSGNNQELLAEKESWESVNLSRVSVLKDVSGDYHLWYGGTDNPAGGGNRGIGYAVSPDGLNWVKSLDNPIFHISDGPTWRDDRTYTPRVLYSASRFDGHGSPEQYKMWFTGKDTASGDYTVGYANLNPVALSLADTSGSGQSGTVGSDLSLPLVVGVRDGCGVPVSSVSISFAISGTPASAGGQSLSVITGTTNAAGQISTTLTLGSKPGVYTVTADATGVLSLPVTFTATAAAGPVDRFVFGAIGDQIAENSFTITVTAEDSFSNTVTSYASPVALTDSTGTISPALSGSFVVGVLTQTLVITAAQTDVVITATHTTTPTITGASNPFEVQPCRVKNLDTGECFVGIQTAIDDADTLNGHTLLATSGIYAENVDIDKRITLQGSGSGDDPSSATIIEAATTEDPVIQVQASGTSASDRLVIRSLRVTGATTIVGGNPGSGIEFDGARSFVTIENVVAVGNEGHGIAIDATGSMQDIQVLSSTLFKNGGSGFRVPGSLGDLSGLVISGSQIYSNTWMGLSVYGTSERDVSVSDTSYAGNATEKDTGGDVVFSSFFTGSVSFSNVAITSHDADAGIRFSGSSSSPGVAPPIALSNVTIEGTQRGAALAISRYTDGSNVNFGNVTLDSSAPSGLHLGSLSGSLDVGDTLFSGSYSTAGSAPQFDVPNPGVIVLGKHRGMSGSDADVSVDATFIDWGVTDLAAIEDRIHHQADDLALGEVLYYTLNLSDDGSTPMADHVSYATITATLTGLLYPTGNIISFTTDLGALSPVTGPVDANGIVTTIITSTIGGTATITGTAGISGDNPKSGTTQIVIAPLSLDHFHFFLIQDQVAGVSFPIAIAALDSSNVIATGFNGRATLADATATLVPTGPIQFQNGIWNRMITITQSYLGDIITATYIHDTSITGDSNAFDVDHNVATTVTISPASETVTAGRSITYTVWATDAYGNDWDATAEAAYAIESGAGGSWKDNAYTSEFTGEWIIRATVDGTGGTALLAVTQISTTAGVNVFPTSVDVGEDGVTAAYSVSLNSQPTNDVTISIAVGEQVTVTLASLAFSTSDWDVVQEVIVTAVDDDEVEGVHTGTISHTATSADGNYDGISIPHVTAYITDNDVAPTPTSVQFSSATYSVRETTGIATITVTLGSTSPVPITVTYATSDGTATGGSDYTAVSGILRFDPDQASRTFPVPVLPDAAREGDETISLTLSNPVNATLGAPDAAILTIVDNVLYLPLIARDYTT